jgi:hypothetical protein
MIDVFSEIILHLLFKLNAHFTCPDYAALNIFMSVKDEVWMIRRLMPQIFPEGLRKNVDRRSLELKSRPP